LEYEEGLIDSGEYTTDEISEKVQGLRKSKLEKLEADLERYPNLIRLVAFNNSFFG
jgi:hypothetical protein